MPVSDIHFWSNDYLNALYFEGLKIKYLSTTYIFKGYLMFKNFILN